jgi:hypothetical protein
LAEACGRADEAAGMMHERDYAALAAPAPALDVTPAGDPYVQQLVAENTRLRTRVATLARRLELQDAVLANIARIVHEAGGMKAAEG